MKTTIFTKFWNWKVKLFFLKLIETHKYIICKSILGSHTGLQSTMSVWILYFVFCFLVRVPCTLNYIPMFINYVGHNWTSKALFRKTLRGKVFLTYEQTNNQLMLNKIQCTSILAIDFATWSSLCNTIPVQLWQLLVNMGMEWSVATLLLL